MPDVVFDISTSRENDRRSIRWALVFTETAMIRADTIRGDNVAALDGEGRWGPLQVVTGELHDGWAGFAARLRKPIRARSASRSVVSIPSYRAGSQGELDIDDEERRLLESVNASITHPPGTLDVTLDAGFLFGLETVTQADPPLADPRRLKWEADTELREVSYVTFDQGADDVVRNKLFAVAIFLGTAAACLVSAMQSVLKRQRRVSQVRPTAMSGEDGGTEHDRNVGRA